MLVGCLAIAGIPPLAGFFSKDEILWSAFKIGGYGQRGVGASASWPRRMTAFYMFRLYHMTFSGAFRGTRRAGSTRPRVADVDDRAAAGPGRRLDAGGLPRHPARASAPRRTSANFFEHFLEPVVRAARTTRWPRSSRHAAHGHGRGAGADGRQRRRRGRRHLPGRATSTRRSRAIPERAGGDARRRPPRAAQQVLRGRAVRRASSCAALALGGGNALCGDRPLRGRRRRRRGAAAASA